MFYKTFVALLCESYLFQIYSIKSHYLLQLHPKVYVWFLLQYDINKSTNHSTHLCFFFLKDVPTETPGPDSTGPRNDDNQKTAMTSKDIANNSESISISKDDSVNTRSSDSSSVEFVGVYVSFNFCAFYQCSFAIKCVKYFICA